MPQADSKKASGQEQQHNAQTVPYPSPYPQHFEDDNIDIYELWIPLWKRKWLVIGVTVVVALWSIVYALQLQSIYKAQALLLPPKTKVIRLLNVLGIQITNVENTTFKGTLSIDKYSNEISADDIYSRFKHNLKSRNLQKKFIQEHGLMDFFASERTPETRDEDIYQEFAELIKLEESNEITSISVELHDAEISAQLVNNLIEFFDKETVAMMVEDKQNLIANQVRDIKYTIASKRQMAKQRREDIITQYEEAASIAQNLGIKERVDSTNIVQNNQLNITTSNIPLYFRGYRALNTEISILKSRESDDPFIMGLRDLQEHLALLHSIKFDQEKISSVYIDQAAYPPQSAIKPNRRLIVSLATVVGLFSGILLVFFIEFVKNQSKLRSG